jgi:hypothetical protein
MELDELRGTDLGEFVESVITILAHDTPQRAEIPNSQE